MIAAGACQWSGVAIKTAWISLDCRRSSACLRPPDRNRPQFSGPPRPAVSGQDHKRTGHDPKSPHLGHHNRSDAALIRSFAPAALRVVASPTVAAPAAAPFKNVRRVVVLISNSFSREIVNWHPTIYQTGRISINGLEEGSSQRKLAHRLQIERPPRDRSCRIHDHSSSHPRNRSPSHLRTHRRERRPPDRPNQTRCRRSRRQDGFAAHCLRRIRSRPDRPAHLG